MGSKKNQTPVYTPPTIEGPPPFNLYLKGRVPGLGAVRLYVNFLRPRAEVHQPEDHGRFTISLVANGTAISERPIHQEWITREGAIRTMQSCFGADWVAERNPHFPEAVRDSVALISPMGFLATILLDWCEAHKGDPRVPRVNPCPIDTERAAS